MSVGVMKDYKLKLRKLRASHTLGTAQIPDLFTVNCCLLLIDKARARDKTYI